MESIEVYTLIATDYIAQNTIVKPVKAEIQLAKLSHMVDDHLGIFILNLSLIWYMTA